MRGRAATDIIIHTCSSAIVAYSSRPPKCISLAPSCKEWESRVLCVRGRSWQHCAPFANCTDSVDRFQGSVYERAASTGGSLCI
eukprot:1142260-Pelagomonas_calceolata.AAC.10